MDRTTYLANFESLAEAVEFEHAALSINREYLPAAALLVRDGAEPGTDYWLWLCAQAAHANAEGR